MKKDTDMTVGNPFRLIGTFSFSLVVGNVFQQLYTFVDTIIIGRKIGPLGLAALVGTEWLIFLVNGIVIGLVSGFSILLGNSFGEKNEEEFDLYYKVSKKICLILAVILTVSALLTSGWILRLLGTKEEVYSMAREYVNTIFLGIPFLTFYQLFSGALRSRGNSHIPLFAMTVSSLCNIAFDILFVNIFGFGIAGAAFGTILSECAVMIICGYYFYHQRAFSENLLPDHAAIDHTAIRSYNEMSIAGKLFKMGIPMTMQSVITSIGGLIVVNRINQYELAFLAGYSAAAKLYGLLEIAASSFGLAAAAYVSQNYGANKIVRIKEGVRASLFMGVAVSLVCSGVMVFFGQDILQLFIDTPDMTGEILQYGCRFLNILALFFPFLYILYILRASLQGINHAVIPMLSSFAQLIMRLFCAIVLTRYIGSDGIFFGEISAWLFADLILLIAYLSSMQKLSAAGNTD
ncbi:MAG: MATE family efflux transporter [Lachnospiraceae bacterium]|nr:MATE family efflux transporter [Lachnospiraceae bacterium]